MLFKAQLSVFNHNLCRYISFRNIKSIDVVVFAEGFSTLFSNGLFSTTYDLVLHYVGLQTILDVCAPLKTRSVSFVNSAPWFTPELLGLKVKGRHLE